MGKAQSKAIRQRKNSQQKDNIVFCEYINKRKYYSSYVFPFDNDEVDRLTVQHYVFQHIWENNFSSPVDNLLRNGANVLDVG
jgi:hypothetical protein